MRSKTDVMIHNLLNALVSAFKLGFVSGFLSSALLGLAPDGGLGAQDAFDEVTSTEWVGKWN